MFTELQVMASHALAIYRGFEVTGPNALVEQTLYNLVGKTLRELPTLRDEWVLSWGPASYRPMFQIVGSSAAYVAQHREHPGRLVVSVRGTNPLSAFDWIFGDLWVDRLVPWRHGTAPAGAAISASTSLGLQSILQMRAQTQQADSYLQAWGKARAAIRDRSLKLVTQALSPLAKQIAEPLRALRDELRQTFDSLALTPGVDWEDHVRALDERQASESRRRTLALIDNAEQAVGAETEFDLLRLLEGGSRLRSLLDQGDSLAEHLEQLVAQIPRGTPIDLTVVGHSKGGALAPTLALWLADQQGQPEGWDPERRAQVHSYSFAGPTAGNAEFAAYSDSRLGSRCHRIFNPLDVVTRAWAPEDLTVVAELYAPAVARSPALADLAAHIVSDLNRLGSPYRHVGAEPIQLQVQPYHGQPMFALQVMHHHLDAYLEGLGLADLMNAQTFFGAGD